MICADDSHNAKLANGGTLGIWVGFAEGHPIDSYHVLNHKTHEIKLTKGINFLDKSHGEWNIVEKLTVVLMSYDGSDDKEVAMILGNNEIDSNIYNVVSDHKSNNEAEENFFEQQNEDIIEVTPKTILNPKVVRALKILQMSYYADEIVEQAKHEKAMN